MHAEPELHPSLPDLARGEALRHLSGLARGHEALAAGKEAGTKDDGLTGRDTGRDPEIH